MGFTNQDWPCGLHPVETLSGECPRTIRYPLKQALHAATPYTTKIYKGQVVCWQNSTSIPYLESVTASTANSAARPTLGVAAEYYAGSATTKTDLAVWPAGDHIFGIQADNATTTTIGMRNILCYGDVINAQSGSTITGLSSCELDWSTLATATTALLQVVGLDVSAGQTSTGSNIRFKVRFAHGYFNETADTVV